VAYRLREMLADAFNNLAGVNELLRAVPHAWWKLPLESAQ
jgi:hypothetical protein